MPNAEKHIRSVERSRNNQKARDQCVDTGIADGKSRDLSPLESRKRLPPR